MSKRNLLWLLIFLVWPNITQAQTPLPTETAVATDIPATTTAVPTDTPSPPATTTAVPTPDLRDLFEPNNEPDQASPITMGSSLTNLTLEPVGDADYYLLYLKTGQLVRAATFPETAADTRLTVYSPAGELLGQNDDRSQTDLGSTVAWLSQIEGWYLLLVESSIPFGGAYRLLTSLDMPTVTPTPAATATPGPTSTAAPTTTPYTQADVGEPNNGPQEAFQILPGAEYAMTLGPVGTDTHDFFTLLGKAGVTYQCQAAQPQGVDPALRVYVGEIGNGVLVAENDDVSSSNIGSQVRFTAQTHTTFYLVAEARAGYGRYTFSCMGNPAPVAGSGGSTPPSPTPTVTPDPAVLQIQVFVDWNGDEQLTAGEGVDDVLVLFTSLGQTLTHYTQQGQVSAEAWPEASQVVVSIPYLHYSQVVNIRQSQQLLLPLAAPTLPVMLP